ncbi:MAG: T9SS type A sorting domain-containing protein [Candidatus Latescibacteria bacterium]|nr:T9SS type A sorting domain-containing protein [Candidatus Latescibacterota bacterium]
MKSLYLPVLSPILLLAALLTVPTQLAAEEYFAEAPLPPSAQLGFALKHGRRVPSLGQLNVLAVFAQFADDEPNDEALPAYATDLFDPDAPGSFSHYFHTLSLNQLQINATVASRRYTSPHPSSAYPPTRTGDDLEAPLTGFGQFALDILRQVDEDYDLGPFDNDGPDGIANSGDDDGYVDFVFIILRSLPDDFLFGPSTGIATMGFQEPYSTNDIGAGGRPIGVRGGYYLGTVLLGKDRAWTVGTMAHEFGHALGEEPLPDLYDSSHLLATPGQDAAQYSAGIGRWGLMGRGTLGWQVNGAPDGPNPFCAWSLEQLGWARPDNGRLVEVRGDTTDLRIADLYRGGALYKIPLRTPRKSSALLPAQYLLLEYRGGGTHYHRRDPGRGLLVWHVKPVPLTGFGNGLEEDKLVDLVCADGLYQDAGYDSGQRPDPGAGRDNLDFWAPDRYKNYRQAHRGNSGDPTDLFDGQRFARLDGSTNPSSLFGQAPSPAYTGPSIRIIEQQDEAVVVDISLPRWAGVISEKIYWAGDILVDGDLVVAPEGELILYPTARIQVAGRDRLQTGLDPERVEIHLQGGLRLVNQSLLYTSNTDFAMVQADSFVFAPAVQGQYWHGIVTDQPLDPRLVLQGTGPVPSAALQAVPTAVVEEAALALADTFSLSPNYPNPFTAETTLSYSLASGAPVQLDIYNALGQPVRRLVDEYRDPGAHEIAWPGRDQAGQQVASGVYLYRLQAGPEQSAQGKMLFLPDGFARLDNLDPWLQDGDADWSELTAEGADTRERFLGFSFELSPEQAAYKLGHLSVELQSRARYAHNADAFALALEEFGPLLQPFGGPARQAVEELLYELKPDQPQRLERLDRALQNLATGHGEATGFYFSLGTWLHPLRTAALTARRRALPLGDILDPAANAATARHFAQALRQAGAVAGPAAVLENLAERLEARPVGLQELGAVLDAIARFEESLEQ